MSNASVLGPAREFYCVCCGRAATSWHHRVPEGRGGPTDRFNCIPVCGDGTRGCHGWIEHHRAEALRAYLLIPGGFERGRYVGPDFVYRARYNGEAWDDERGWYPIAALAWWRRELGIEEAV